MNVGNNLEKVPEKSLERIQKRVIGSGAGTEVERYFRSEAAQRSLIEFQTMYCKTVKEFFYIAMINDYEADSINKWMDDYKYTRMRLAETPPKVYVLHSVDEIPIGNQTFSFTVETKVSLHKSEGIELTSTFLDNGYNVPKIVERDTKIAKFYYKHEDAVAKRERDHQIVSALTARISETSRVDIQHYQAKIILKLQAHFWKLSHKKIIEEEVLSQNMGLRPVDKLKASISNQKRLHGSVGLH